MIYCLCFRSNKVYFSVACEISIENLNRLIAHTTTTSATQKPIDEFISGTTELTSVYKYPLIITSPECFLDTCFILCHTRHQKLRSGKTPKALPRLNLLKVNYNSGTRTVSIDSSHFTVITPYTQFLSYPPKAL